jgi:endonuclease/exonuclease/phosphatase family metal-dependent hydrolase
MLRIDHIFCGRSVDMLGVEVPRSQLVRTASDHLPLVMDFRIVFNGFSRCLMNGEPGV